MLAARASAGATGGLISLAAGASPATEPGIPGPTPLEAGALEFAHFAAQERDEMLARSTMLKGRQRAAGLIGVAAVGGCLLTALACLGGNLTVWGQRINSRPLVVHVDQFTLSADITFRPFCAPLLPSDVCLVQQPDHGPKYFSVWVYVPDRQMTGWHLSGRNVIAVRLDLEQ